MTNSCPTDSNAPRDMETHRQFATSTAIAELISLFRDLKLVSPNDQFNPMSDDPSIVHCNGESDGSNCQESEDSLDHPSCDDFQLFDFVEDQISHESIIDDFAIDDDYDFIRIIVFRGQANVLGLVHVTAEAEPEYDDNGSYVSVFTRTKADIYVGPAANIHPLIDQTYRNGLKQVNSALRRTASSMRYVHRIISKLPRRYHPEPEAMCTTLHSATQLIGLLSNHLQPEDVSTNS